MTLLSTNDLANAVGYYDKHSVNQEPERKGFFIDLCAPLIANHKLPKTSVRSAMLFLVDHQPLSVIKEYVRILRDEKKLNISAHAVKEFWATYYYISQDVKHGDLIVLPGKRLVLSFKGHAAKGAAQSVYSKEVRKLKGKHDLSADVFEFYHPEHVFLANYFIAKTSSDMPKWLSDTVSHCARQMKR